MDILSSIAILFIIALLWIGIIFLAFKRMAGHQTKRDKWMFLGGLLLFIAMIAIVMTGTVVFEYIESPKFCGTFCHVMEPFYDSYISPGNNQMMATHTEREISCSNCHNEPGIVGTIQGFMGAIPEAYSYFIGGYDPNNLGGEVSRNACLKCHDSNIAIAPGDVITVSGVIVNPHTDEKKCTECHSSHHEGFGLTQNACSVCHGTSSYNFEAMLSDHAKRAGIDCMNCHNRNHPDDARISFSEYPTLINTDFCSDCHEGDVEKLGSGPHKSKSCTNCHNEHGELSISFDNCKDPCHNPPAGHNATTSSCSVCHDLTKIHLKSNTDLNESFSDIVCSNCHAAENSAYTSSFTLESLKIYGNNGCFECHSEHKAISYPHLKTPPYNDCGSCHNTYKKASTIHDRNGISYLGFSGITNNFCSDCHSGEVEKLSKGIHSQIKCVDCHSEHNTIRVNFNSCTQCHDPPSGHDVSTTSCSDCHDGLSQIHSGTGNDSGGSTPDETCLSCHDGKPGPVPPIQVQTVAGTVTNPHAGEKNCTDCHGILHAGYSGFTKEACAVCHGTKINNFEKSLSSHSNRVGADCMRCHNRNHPTDARIPFSEYSSIIDNEFCSDCHTAEVTRLSRGEHNSIECTDCHSEHGILQVKFNNCELCHDIPSNHNASLTSCSGSTCHDDLEMIHSET